METTDINSKPGDIVIFLEKNGYAIQVKNAIEDGLVKGVEYVISDINVEAWNTTLYLEGFKNGYNSVMFKNK